MTIEATVIAEDILSRVKQLKFYQKIDLPDGTTTSGKADHRNDPALLRLDRDFMRGRSLLDIASNDGFWAFWAESQGASEVLAIDVERFEQYDWGMHGVPPEYRGKPAKNENFDVLMDLFKSSVKREQLSVYDLDPAKHGTFDVVICYGLIYHLRHPLLAIDKVRAVTKEIAVLNTHTLLAARDLPYNVFFLDDVFGNAITNWTGASEAAMVHWMKDAGFGEVFVKKAENPRPGINHISKIYVGTVTPEAAALMQANPAFRHCDQAYFARSRKAVEDVLSGKSDGVGGGVSAQLIQAVRQEVQAAVRQEVQVAVRNALEEQRASQDALAHTPLRKARAKMRKFAAKLREQVSRG